MSSTTGRLIEYRPPGHILRVGSSRLMARDDLVCGREPMNAATSRQPVRCALALASLILCGVFGVGTRAGEPVGISNPVHKYDAPPSQDRLAKLKGEVEAGRVKLDTSDELALLKSVLKSLDVPVSSQMLVTS